MAHFCEDTRLHINLYIHIFAGVRNPCTDPLTARLVGVSQIKTTSEQQAARPDFPVLSAMADSERRKKGCWLTVRHCAFAGGRDCVHK